MMTFSQTKKAFQCQKMVVIDLKQKVNCFVCFTSGIMAVRMVLTAIDDSNMVCLIDQQTRPKAVKLDQLLQLTLNIQIEIKKLKSSLH